jgi:hypothetical protein
MSLHNLAHHVRAKGRGKDSMLVHMTPREVEGLQALAKAKGGTLTINPETGLPEAGFLDQILPVVAMAAATYFTAGAAAPALSTALGVSSGVGGALAGGLAGAGFGALGAGLQGKDVGKGALLGGLGGAVAGGMGAYDNVYQAVDAGAMSNAQNVAQANQNLITAPTDVSNVTSGLAGQAPAIPGAADPARAAYLDSLASANKVFPEGSSQLQGAGLTEAPAKLANAPEIVNPKSIYQGFGPDMGLKKAATLAAPGIAGLMDDTPEAIPGEDPYKSRATLASNFQGYTPPQPNPYYRAQYTRYAAGGGLMDAYQAGGPVERMSMANTAMNPQGGLYPQGMIDKTQYATPIQRPVSSEMISEVPAYERSSPMLMSSGGDTRKKKRAPLTADRTINSLDPYNAAIAQLNNARYGANLSGVGALNPAMTSLGELPVIAGAKGGIADLGGYSDGGRMLKGPGDGMSDSIPASIGNRQPARLADGEFVVPADVVSHLGNGSTDAGARKLYSMMDKIRKARTGKKKQAPAVNTNRFMPA